MAESVDEEMAETADAPPEEAAAQEDEAAAAEPSPDEADSEDDEDDIDVVADFYGETGDEEPPAEPEAKEEPAPEKIVIGKVRRRSRMPTGIAAAWLGLCAVVGGIGYFAVTERVAVVRALPGSAWLYTRLGLPVNVRGLDFRDVAYSWETDDGRVVLEVHGDIVNITRDRLDVPRVVFALRDAASTEVYQWEDQVVRDPLAAGESATFAIRIPTPPKSIKSVQVRFAGVR